MPLLRPTFAALAAALLLAHGIARADEPAAPDVASPTVVAPPPPPILPAAPVPPPAAETRTRRPLLVLGIVGAGTVVVSWVASIVTVFASNHCTGGVNILHGSDLSCHSASGFLLIPAAGPYLAMADNLGSETPLSWENPLYVALSVVNTLAIVAIPLGFAYKVRVPVEAWDAGELRLTPFASSSATGLALSGTF